jgi:hypothetical protein
VTSDESGSSDEEAFAAISAELLEAVARTLPGWVDRVVRERATDAGLEIDESARAAASAAGAAAVAEVIPRLQVLLATDIDEQRTNPLSVLREAVRFPTEVLVALGVPQRDRDDFAVRSFPEDLYDLSPAAFADIDPELHEPGLRWGAAKAYVHLRRRRPEP